MWNPLDLTGRRILVTGASAGIGRETAVVLSRLGARIVAVARNGARLEETLGLLEGDGHALSVQDLSACEAIPAWMKTLTREDPLHGLVHSAGVVLPRPLRILNVADIRAIYDLNTTAAMMLAKGFRQKGVCAEGGSILYISSVAALKGQPSLAPYAASKGALISLTRTLACELAKEKIRVNCVCPGLVKTQMADNLQGMLTDDAYRQIEAAYPLGVGTPADVAQAIAFLLSDAARWITGVSLVLDGGYTA